MSWAFATGLPSSLSATAPAATVAAIGGDAVAERTESFDPLASFDR